MNSILLKRMSGKNVRGIIEKMDEEVMKINSKKGKLSPKVLVEFDKTIRWGCTSNISSKLVYNKRTAIKKASNKLNARRILEDADIPIPKTYNAEEILHKDFNFPIIGRPMYHFGGRNFNFCEDEWDVTKAIRNGSEYFSEFYPKTREFRIHACSGKILICCEKFVENIDKKIWNLTKGGEWKALRWSNIPANLAKLAISAVNALGLDFGAVDILAEPKDDSLPEAVVLEVNTAPRLGKYSSNRYAEYFDWLLEGDDLKEKVDASYDYWNNFIWSHEDFNIK